MAELRHRVRGVLFALSDWLCALGLPPAAGDSRRRGLYRATFQLGHWAGELGWRFR